MKIINKIKFKKKNFSLPLFNILFSNNFIDQKYYRHSSDLASFKSLEDASKALTSQIVVSEEGRSRAEADLRIEREWRSALQAKEHEYKEAITKLQIKINQHSEESKKYEKAKNELERLRKKYNEDQQTLEELGHQLSMSKLQVSELKERSKMAEDLGNGKILSSSEWTPDESASNCHCCNSNFSLTKRKHHCRCEVKLNFYFLSSFKNFIFSRSCGNVVCKSCSEHVLPLEEKNGEF